MLENHITRDPLPDSTGLIHLEKHYIDYGVLQYTATRHFYARNIYDLDRLVRFWDRVMNPDLSGEDDESDDGEADEDEEEEASYSSFCAGSYCTIPNWDD